MRLNDVAAPSARFHAFAWDYFVVLGYLVALTGVGLLLGGHRPMYDRLAGTAVVRERAAA